MILAASKLFFPKSLAIAGITAVIAAVFNETTAPSSHKRAKNILLLFSFSFNYFLKYFQIIFRVFIDKTFHLLIIKLGFLIHLKMLDPGYLRTFRFRSIEPDDLHIFKREFRLFPLGIGKIFFFKK